MHPRSFRDVIVRAVENEDEEMLLQVSKVLSEVEGCKSILRAKGYGEIGSTLAQMVKDVPVAAYRFLTADALEEAEQTIAGAKRSAARAVK
jgi:hypothetical protein